MGKRKEKEKEVKTYGHNDSKAKVVIKGPVYNVRIAKASQRCLRTPSIEVRKKQKRNRGNSNIYVYKSESKIRTRGSPKSAKNSNIYVLKRQCGICLENIYINVQRALNCTDIMCFLKNHPLSVFSLTKHSVGDILYT